MEQEDQKVRKDEGGSEGVIGSLIEVHRRLGPGLLESTYGACFRHELRLRGLSFERQRPVCTTYEGLVIDCGCRVDVLVDRRTVVELKSVERLLPVHAAQLPTYMRLLVARAGLLVNFNVTSSRLGLRRLSLPPPPSS